MGSRTVFVHSRFTHFPVAGTLLHEALNLSNTLNDEAGEVLDKDALVGVLLELKLGIHVFGEQVPDVLVVDLKIGTAHQELHLSCVALVNEPENVLKRIRNDAPLGGVVLVTHHGVGLAAAGLAVCEDRAVVALDDGLDEGEGALVVDLPLGRVPVVNRVVGEDLGHLAGVAWLRQDHLVCLPVALHTYFRTYNRISLDINGG